MTLDELLALIPDQPEGNISAADLRTIVTELHSETAAIENRVALLESRFNVAIFRGAWQFVDTAPPPTGSQLRMDNADQTLATELHFRVLDTTGVDQTALFAQDITAIRLQDEDNAAAYRLYTVTGPAVVATGTAVVPVAFESGGAALPNQRVLAVFAVDLT